MQDLILIGGGGHCKSCIDVIEQENKFNIVGILDTAKKVGNEILGYKIIGTDSDIKKLVDKNYFFLITVGQIDSAKIRINILKQLKKYNAKIATIISPRAQVSKHSKIGEGSIIMHDAFVNAGVVIGDNCIINTKSLLEHDVKIGNNCHISIASVLAGEVEIGDNSFVGANSTIVQCVKISNGSFIKAGSLIK